MLGYKAPFLGGKDLSCYKEGPLIKHECFSKVATTSKRIALHKNVHITSNQFTLVV